ncbi:MAG: phenylacetate-CoA oxygenase subunit PaaJ [Corynebacterium humireducens]|uniref:Phenylacetic acid degradation protein n=2 Tax=Corynebacterium humireducens TaxID=1223514 RepID=A0A0B5DBM2_9CORY|nr:1,2-phenylacetyl-CoA epoxidase subunit PaaD [Corynebacterium humireducens]AJE34342.1 phenylacetic acid degradation protein [Corynebacterium humireducens NBRC 106098 = DSM 45392]NLA55212.1 phenylacetate-CoA oxygenase subunit PaaJ [Corynebacterium humireducens]
MTTHPLRPTDPEAAKVWDTAASVPDPEIPVISIADLGILRDAAIIDGTAVVTITPTYSGCPAMDHITREVEEALVAAGYENSRVDLVLQPAWTTDWITEEGREQLRDYGIAPPVHAAGDPRQGPIKLTLAPPPPVPCPRCGSTRTKNIAQFGSTSCKALYSCEDCLEPFDYFKVH